MLNLTETNFQKEVLESDLPVLVDFWAQWCGPCQMAEPILEELANHYGGKVKIAKVNVDENSTLAAKYAVMSIPTLIGFKNGKEVKRQIGFPGKEGYLKLLGEILG